MENGKYFLSKNYVLKQKYNEEIVKKFNELQKKKNSQKNPFYFRFETRKEFHPKKLFKIEKNVMNT